MPLLSEHSNNITLNEKLFARVKEVYDQKETLQLTQEQSQLLETHTTALYDTVPIWKGKREKNTAS